MGQHSGPYRSCDPNKSPDEMLAQAQQIFDLMKSGKTISRIAQELSIGRTTIYARLARANGLRPEGLSYAGAHGRVKSLKGRAGTHRCACGAQAEDWAYNHADPNEVTWPYLGPYSLDPNYYVPMCVPCHKRLDSAHRRTKVTRGWSS